VGISSKTCIRSCSSGDGIVSQATADKHSPIQLIEFRRSSSHPCAAFIRRRKKCQSGNSRICAQMVMTDNKRAQVAIPYQDRRNLSCLAWFSSPRGTTCNTNFRREMRQIRRMSHGSARSIEGLRKLRLSLVPSPDTRYCVLQRVSVEITNVSNSGKP
jgi:hypothetical protein